MFYYFYKFCFLYYFYKTTSSKLVIGMNGTYLRNGPGLWNIGDHDFRHLFDGYSTLVKLQFDGGRIFAAHRLLESDAYKAAKKHNRLCYREFSETPKSVIINKNPFLRDRRNRQAFLRRVFNGQRQHRSDQTR